MRERRPAQIHRVRRRAPTQCRARLALRCVKEAVRLGTEQTAAPMLALHLIDAEARPIAERHAHSASRREHARIDVAHLIGDAAIDVTLRLVRAAELIEADRMDAERIEGLAHDQIFERASGCALRAGGGDDEAHGCFKDTGALSDFASAILYQ